VGQRHAPWAGPGSAFAVEHLHLLFGVAGTVDGGGRDRCFDALPLFGGQPHAAHPIADLQIEYSLVSRGREASILPAVAELGMRVTAYGVLSRGLLSGSTPAGKGDFRAYLPRFAGENFAGNRRIVETLRELAAQKGASASARLQIAVSDAFFVHGLECFGDLPGVVQCSI
jgi:Aldo/keto reductase family